VVERGAGRAGRSERFAAPASERGGSGVRGACSEALVAQYRRGDRVVEVDLAHVAAYASQLHDLLLEHPNEYLPIVRATPRRVGGGG
jgi:hypothetical protein